MNTAKQREFNSNTKFEKAIESVRFKKLMGEKKRFIIPLTVLFLILYFTLPVLTSFTKVLHAPAIGDITWVWLFSFFLIVMTWSLVTIYIKKSAKFDKMAAKIIEEEFPERAENG